MNYELISETYPRARKQYRCIWCGEIIEKSTRHVHEVSKYDFDLQDHRWHTECFKYARDSFEDADDNEFLPYENSRPTERR